MIKDELELDRAKTKITEISELGLVEMTRKRIRPSLVSTLTKPCTYCDGKGYIKRRMTVANEIFRALEREVERTGRGLKAYVECHSDIADWIYEEDAQTLDFIESKLQSPVIFKANHRLHIEEFIVSLK